MNEYQVTEHEEKQLERFRLAINKSKIWNENKYYLESYINAFIANNFITAANTGFVFLEKYLRTKLIYIEYSQEIIPWRDFLHSIDRIEELLEEWEWANPELSQKLNRLIKNIKNYWKDESVNLDLLKEELENLTREIDSEWPIPNNWYNFIDTCNKLKDLWAIDNSFKKELLKAYRKFRNPLHHWLFRKLIESVSEKEDIIPVVCWWIENPWIENIKPSSFLIREWNQILIPVCRRVCVELFIIIDNSIKIFDDFK